MKAWEWIALGAAVLAVAWFALGKRGAQAVPDQSAPVTSTSAPPSSVTVIPLAPQTLASSPQLQALVNANAPAVVFNPLLSRTAIASGSAPRFNGASWFT